MHRVVAGLAAFVFLASASAALADGPGYISQGGPGLLAANGKFRFVAVPVGGSTAIERVVVRGGSVLGWASLDGAWGIPSPTVSQVEGLTRDGRKLVIQSAGVGAPTHFAVISTRTLRVLDRFTLDGSFAYDAMSPDASTLYLIQHVASWNFNRYVVRSYDLRTHTLQPGRIADKTQLGWVMEGSALTRATSSDGRWVYTLYQHPGGYPFIHALDTVNGIAHCTGLPWHGDQTALWNIRLTLAEGGRTLSVQWRSGKPWLAMNTASWRLTHVRPHAAGGFAWHWPAIGVGGALLILFATALVSRRMTSRSRRGSAAPPIAAMD